MTNVTTTIVTNNVTLTNLIEEVICHEVTNRVVQIVEPVVVSSDIDWWSRISSIFGIITGICAVAIAWVSLRHSNQTAKQSSEMNSASIKLQVKSTEKQIEVADHQMRHDKLSISPVIQFICKVGSEGEPRQFREISIINTGLGPAWIHPPLLILDQKPIALFQKSNLEKLCRELKIEKIGFVNAPSRFILQPNEVRKIIWIEFPITFSDGAILKDLDKRIDVICPYSSLYETPLAYMGMKNKSDYIEIYNKVNPDCDKIMFGDFSV